MVGHATLASINLLVALPPGYMGNLVEGSKDPAAVVQWHEWAMLQREMYAAEWEPAGVDI